MTFAQTLSAKERKLIQIYTVYKDKKHVEQVGLILIIAATVESVED